jgi:poly-gamma-glutamate system protein
MKKIYWRPQSTPLFASVFIAFLAVGGLASVEHFQVVKKKPYYIEKMEASKLTLEAMELVKEERLDRGIPVDPQADPTGSGLIGSFVTSVTSEAGDLEAKQTSVNPNLAAVTVELLKEAGVKDGDPVAVSFSGSFPALNIAACAAMATLRLKPLIISSASSSQWGANNPDFLWIDMEHVLNSKGVIPFRSVAASMGGKHDRAVELTERGREQILQAINRNKLTLIKSATIHEDIDQRMVIYFSKVRPKAYLNVGGGRAAVGIRPLKRLLKPGLIFSDLPAGSRTDSVIRRFLKEGIPVIHLGEVKELAGQYRLPISPTTMPKVGEGSVYSQKTYNLWLAGVTLLAIILGLYVFARSDWGFRMLQASPYKKENGPPEPMI